MTRITTRYVVRNARGEELVVPSLEDLHELYESGFLTDDDEVRRERSYQWTPVRAFPALHGVREARRASPIRVVVLALAVAVLALAVKLLLARPG
jgi:hypothetical protein